MSFLEKLFPKNNSQEELLNQQIKKVKEELAGLKEWHGQVSTGTQMEPHRDDVRKLEEIEREIASTEEKLDELRDKLAKASLVQ